MWLFFRFCNWIGDISNTIILTPTPYAVGNAAEEVYFGLLKARRENRKLLVIFPFELPWKLTFHLINVDILQIKSEHMLQLPFCFNLIARCLITAIYAMNKLIGLFLRIFLSKNFFRSAIYNVPMIGAMTLWQPRDLMRGFSWKVVDEYNWRDQIGTQLNVQPRVDDDQFFRRNCLSIGLPGDAWFVCIHVRESGFHDDEASERNANILNYIPAIKEVTGRGGWVIRLGDKSMTPLPDIERVIDYPFTDVKSPLMDMLLISKCSLYIGMTSGIYDLALLFQRPIILTNISSWLFGLPPKKTDICVMKHIYSKSRGRFLSIKEWLDEPWDSMSFRTLGSDYVLFENTKDELLRSVKWYFERGALWTPTQVQIDFQRLRRENGRRILDSPIFFGDTAQQNRANKVENPFEPDDHLYDTMERYRLASRLDSSEAMLEPYYLIENWEIDNYQAI